MLLIRENPTRLPIRFEARRDEITLRTIMKKTGIADGRKVFSREDAEGSGTMRFRAQKY